MKIISTELEKRLIFLKNYNSNLIFLLEIEEEKGIESDYIKFLKKTIRENNLEIAEIESVKPLPYKKIKITLKNGEKLTGQFIGGKFIENGILFFKEVEWSHKYIDSWEYD